MSFGPSPMGALLGITLLPDQFFPCVDMPRAVSEEKQRPGVPILFRDQSFIVE